MIWSGRLLSQVPGLVQPLERSKIDAYQKPFGDPDKKTIVTTNKVSTQFFHQLLSNPSSLPFPISLLGWSWSEFAIWSPSTTVIFVLKCQTWMTSSSSYSIGTVCDSPRGYHLDKFSFSQSCWLGYVVALQIIEKTWFLSSVPAQMHLRHTASHFDSEGGLGQCIPSP